MVTTAFYITDIDLAHDTRAGDRELTAAPLTAQTTS
jgi:hypothetical protein